MQQTVNQTLLSFFRLLRNIQKCTHLCELMINFKTYKTVNKFFLGFWFFRDNIL